MDLLKAAVVLPRALEVLRLIVAQSHLQWEDKGFFHLHSLTTNALKMVSYNDCKQNPHISSHTCQRLFRFSMNEIVGLPYDMEPTS